MRYVITGKRGNEIRSRSSTTAAECAAYADDMLHQGFTIMTIVDADRRPIELEDVRAEAKQVRVGSPEHRGSP